VDWPTPFLVSAAVSAVVLVAAYLYGRRLRASRQQHARESRVLLDIASVASSTLYLTEVLKQVAQRTAQACRAHRCTILMLAEGGEMLVPTMSQFSDGNTDREMWRLFKDARYPMPVSQVPEAQRVIREQRPLFIPDVLASSLPSHWIEPFGVKSVLTVPLISKGRVIGLMVLDHVEQGRGYTTGQVDLAVAIAAHAATAIENARLYGRERQQVARRARMLELSRELRLNLDLPETLTRICQAVVGDLGWQQVILSLRDYETKTSRPVAMAGYDAETVASTLALPSSPFGELDILREEFRISHSYYIDHRHRDAIADYPDELIVTAPAPDLDLGGWHPDDILLVPIEGREGILGFISPDNPVNRQRPTLEMVQELEVFANQAAVAIENAWLYEEAQHRLQSLTNLNRVSQVITSSLDVKELLEQVVELAGSVVNSDYTSVMLLDEEGQPVLGAEDFRGVSPIVRRIRSSGVARHVLDSGQPVLVDVISDEGAMSPPLWRADGELMEANPDIVAAGIHSFAAVPIQAKGRMLGVLFVHSRRLRAFHGQVSLLTTFANQVAVAVENARLFEAEKRRVAQLKAISEVGRDIASILDLDVLLHRVVNLLADVFGYYYASILMVDEETQEIVLTASAGQTGRAFEGYRLKVGEQGITGWVAGSGEPLVVNDVHKEPRYHFIEELADTRSELSVPIKLKEKVIGVLDVQSDRLNAFDEMHLFTLFTLADQMTVAIENSRLLEETRRQLARVQALADASHRMAASLNLRETLEGVALAGLEALGADRVAIYLYDAERDTLGLGYAGGLSSDYTDLLLAQFRSVPGYRLLQSPTPIWVRDAQSDPEAKVLWEMARREGFHSYVLLALQHGGRPIGVMGYYHDDIRAYTDEDMQLCQALANQAAVAIQNARLFDETQQRARQWEALTEVGQAIGSILDLDEVLQLVLGRLEDVVPYDAVSLWLREGEVLRIQAARGFESSEAHLGLAVALQDDALSQEIVSTQLPLVLADAQQDERFHSLGGTEWVRSWLGLPLLSKGKVIGLATINKREPGLYTAETAELALTFGQQAAIAIENARLYEETKRRAEEMTTLYHTSLEIATKGLPDLLWTICDRAARMLGVGKGGLYLYDEAREELELVVSYKLGRDYTGTRIKLGEGVAGHVVQTEQPLVVDDYCHWAGRAGVYDEEPFVTVIAVPLRWKGRIIGAITLSEETARRAFTSDDERLLSLFAQQAAVAIENTRLYEETRRHVEELTVLHNIDMVITSTLNPDEVLQTIYEQVSTVMNITTFHIALYDEEKDELCLPVIVDQGKRLPPLTLKVEEESGLSGWVVRTRQPLWIGDMDEERDTLPVDAIAVGDPTRSLMVLPLIARGKVVGVISAQSYEPYVFDEGHRRLFSGIASQVAIAVENARLYQEATRRLAEARLVQEVMLAAASTLDFDLVLERAVKALHWAFDIDCIGFLLPDEEESKLVPHQSLVGFAGSIFQIPIEGSLVGRAYRTGQPVLARDATQESAFEHGPETCSVLAVPVRIGGHVVAVLYAESPQVGAFGEDEMRLFITIAGQLGVTLENARLYQRLEAQTAELSQAYSELQEFDRLRTELVQNVGHELRTPLGLVKGYVELLLAGGLGRILDSQQKALQIINERTATLERLIHNLTMLQTMHREMLALAPVPVVEVVQRALRAFRRSAEGTGIVFREELPPGLPPVLGDRERLELVFGHLIDNAVKFSPDGGTVIVRAWADQEMVCVSIADEGIGIPSEYLSYIFGRFYQVNGTARRRFGGMGVGLALVWEIVEAHNGTVTVESEPGEGSTFTVALPQAEGR